MFARSRGLTLLKRSFLASSRLTAKPFSGAVRKQMAVPINEIHFDTMVDMFEKSMKANADANIFGTYVDGKYEWMKYREFEREVAKFRNVLAHHNFGADDKVSVICNNRVEWVVVAFAAASRGGHIVPMYEAQLESDWRYIIEDSDSKVVVAANDRIYSRVKEYVGNVGKVEAALCLDADASEPHSYKYWMNKVDSEEPVPIVYPSPDHLMTIIYTSGTTGKPKGVELTHSNLVANLEGLRGIWGHEQFNTTSLAFLPWAHVFGQTCELYSLMAIGSAMAIAPSREMILESLPLVRPNIMISVPTLFNRVYDGVMIKVANDTPLKQKIFHAALANARARNHAIEYGNAPSWFVEFKHKLFDKIVFSKIRDRFGGRLDYMCSGGAANNIKVLHFFEDIGIPICEGYGLTETSPVLTSSMTSWERRRLGTTGVVLPNVTVKIFDPATMEELGPDMEGEVCGSGPSIMRGYRKNDAANAEVFHTHTDGKKYFRTGDLGMMLEGKFLKITGRIKEQFKLENGKYVVPAPLEDIISRSRYIAQTFLYGDNKPFNVVLIVPEFVELRAWADKNGLSYKNDKDEDDDQVLMELDEVKGLLSKEILECSATMKGFEQPKKWTHTLELFTQDNYLLTPKMSIRRVNVMKVYGEQILNLYSGDSGVTMRNSKTDMY